jgi:hypothetical protein
MAITHVPRDGEVAPTAEEAVLIQALAHGPRTGCSRIVVELPADVVARVVARARRRRVPLSAVLVEALQALA